MNSAEDTRPADYTQLRLMSAGRWCHLCDGEIVDGDCDCDWKWTP